jgi:kynurenine formamidase
MVAVKMGRGRRVRRIQPHHTGKSPRCGEVDQGRQDLQNRPGLRVGHAAVRRAHIRIAHSRQSDRRPFGDNKMVYHDEFLATEIGQTGTQFDGLGHIGIQMGKDGDKSEMRFYNGHTAAEISDAYGLKKLGIEKLKPIFTRAHLVDMVALKGGMMDAGQEIMAADIKAALAKQNIPESDIKPGDAIMFHTGWGSLWMKNNDRFNSGEPGIGLDAAKWVIEKDLALTAADTWAVEVVPNPDKSLAFVVHAELQTKHGIHNHENLIFDELIADKKYQFVYCFTPAPIKGATGSNGCPIAIT